MLAVDMHDNVSNTNSNDVIDWTNAHWEAAVLVSSPPWGAEMNSKSISKSTHRRANLFFHGWLFEAVAAANQSAAQKYPLVGIFDASGILEFDSGDGCMLGTGFY